MIVASCPPSSFSRLIAPGPNFPLVNYLRHNGHSAGPTLLRRSSLLQRRRGRPKPKSFAPGSLRGSSSPSFTLTKTDHFLPPFDWPSQCTDFICGRSKIPMCNVRSDLWSFLPLRSVMECHLLGRAFELGQRLLFKHCIVIAYAVSCCLLPMQTPYYL